MTNLPEWPVPATLDPKTPQEVSRGGEPQKHPSPYAVGRDRADAGRPGVDPLQRIVPLDPPAVGAIRVGERDALDCQRTYSARAVAWKKDNGELPAKGACAIHHEQTVALVQRWLHRTTMYEGNPKPPQRYPASSGSWCEAAATAS